MGCPFASQISSYVECRREKEEIIIEDEPTLMQPAEHEDDIVYWNSWVDENCMVYDDVTQMTTNTNEVEVNQINIL